MPGFEVFGEEERKEVNDVLETGVLFRYGFDQARNGMWKAKTFEAELAEYVDAKYCHLCSSGTAALIIALASCGIGAGDEVIVPPFTFVATIEAVLYAGAVPVFSEIDETLCLDPDALEKVLTPKTKAVIPVHMCGAMAHIDRIKDFCDRKGLILIEDTCQAVGGTFNGKALGTFGRMGCYSFDAVKTITCGEGGAVITNDKETYLTAQAYADHGHDHIGNDRGKEDHPILGLNFRISELNAAVGLAQLRKLKTIVDKHRYLKTAIKNELKGMKGVKMRIVPDESGDSATFLSFFAPDAAAAATISDGFGQAGVDGCFYWYANNWHYHCEWNHIKNLDVAAKLPLELLPHRPDYKAMELPVSDDIMGKLVCMQIKLSWSDQDLEIRIAAMKKVIQETL